MTRVELMLDGLLSDQEVAVQIAALRERGESAQDIVDFVREISRRAVPIPLEMDLMDVCGTGGSGLSRFNVSTACAFVLSALGIPILKHGNRGSQRPNGSFDLLEALGIRIEQSSDEIVATVRECGLGFVFAKHFHPCMRAVARGRALAGGRSIFNLAGPLSNPARISRQIIGTADPDKLEVLAQACLQLGRSRAVVVYGEPGIDEISISGTTHVIECGDGEIKRYQLHPDQFSIPVVAYRDIPGGDVEVNTVLFRELLEGNASPALLDLVALNAGLGVYVAGRSTSIEQGVEMARRCVETGRLNTQFERYLAVVRSLPADGEGRQLRSIKDA